jgi:acyl dehydratase
MAIDYPAILDRRAVIERHTWTDHDFIQYALCLGFGNDPLDERALKFVYESELSAVPTMPTVLAWLAPPTFTELGVDPITALHGEQRIDLHRPIPVPVTVSVEGSVVGVYDKGKGRGAVIVTQHVIRDVADGAPIATLTTTCFGRAEGGCGGSREDVPKPHAVPARPPDVSLDFPTRPDLALFYRLTGDRNPIHAVPRVARDGGFPRPILHGLCSFGITCHAVLKAFADLDPTRIASHQARFSAPVFPGETLTVDLWRDGEIVSFEVRVQERNLTVMKHGKSVLTVGCDVREPAANSRR